MDGAGINRVNNEHGYPLGRGVKYEHEQEEKRCEIYEFHQAAGAGCCNFASSAAI
jgi:hypothetical protein